MYDEIVFWGCAFWFLACNLLFSYRIILVFSVLMKEFRCVEMKARESGAWNRDWDQVIEDFDNSYSFLGMVMDFSKWSHKDFYGE